MRVKEIMTNEAVTCTPEASLANVAQFMWEQDCGALPVVEDGKGVVGMITDRDICMAAAMSFRPAFEIPVREVITGEVYSCSPETEVTDALKLMREKRVRRLPVVDAEGMLQGILSMNDVVLEAKEAKGKKETTAPTFTEVIETYKALCTHRTLPQVQTEPPAPQVKTTTA
ncbi:MAG: CBS domain-containing protein [Acidobacteriota bacterium]|nr:CBS domain-containing protein [Acidobacteriota bacterium]